MKKKQACVEISLDTIYNELNSLKADNQKQHEEIKDLISAEMSKAKVNETKIKTLESQVGSIFAGMVTLVLSGITLFFFGK